MFNWKRYISSTPDRSSYVLSQCLYHSKHIYVLKAFVFLINLFKSISWKVLKVTNLMDIVKYMKDELDCDISFIKVML